MHDHGPPRYIEAKEGFQQLIEAKQKDVDAIACAARSQRGGEN